MRVVFFMVSIFLLFGCKDQEFKYYENGSLRYQVDLIDGKWNGELIEYYESGKVKVKSQWLNGKQTGIAKHYYENGQLEEISNWLDGLSNGRAMKYYESGKLMFRASYSKGAFIDTSYFFFENGRLGEKKIYDNNGDVAYILSFDKNGKENANLAMPVINWGNDTVDVNEIITVTFKYYLPISGTIRADFSLLDPNKPDTTILGGGSETFVYKKRFSSVGINDVYLSIYHDKEDKDTLSADGLIIKHSIFVKGPNKGKLPASQKGT